MKRKRAAEPAELIPFALVLVLRYIGRSRYDDQFITKLAAVCQQFRSILGEHHYIFWSLDLRIVKEFSLQTTKPRRSNMLFHRKQQVLRFDSWSHMTFWTEIDLRQIYKENCTFPGRCSFDQKTNPYHASTRDELYWNPPAVCGITAQVKDGDILRLDCRGHPSFWAEIPMSKISPTGPAEKCARFLA